MFFSVSVGGVKFSALVAFAWLTLPICFVKQVISIIQLIVACINTAHLDEIERERVNKWLAIEAEKPNGILPLWTHLDWCQSNFIIILCSCWKCESWHLHLIHSSRYWQLSKRVIIRYIFLSLDEYLMQVILFKVGKHMYCWGALYAFLIGSQKSI